jgi:multimeric flavodoxin WrbA
MRSLPVIKISLYLQPMYKAIAEADAIVFGSPIYTYPITDQAKTWLDRTFPMVEELSNKFIPRHPDKKLITIFSQGSLDPKKEYSFYCL